MIISLIFIYFPLDSVIYDAIRGAKHIIIVNYTDVINVVLVDLTCTSSEQAYSISVY